MVRPDYRARRQRGSMLLVIVFFMIAGGALAAGILAAMRGQSVSVALDLQGVRAYWAASSALEWGVYKVLDPDNTQALAAEVLPACFTSPYALVLPGEMAAFTISMTCQRLPATGSHEEQQNRLTAYVLTATASSGAVGSADRVERQIQTIVMKCKNPVAGSAADGYAC